MKTHRIRAGSEQPEKVGLRPCGTAPQPTNYTLTIDKTPPKPPQTVLHDNAADPYQLKNIAAERPDVVRRTHRIQPRASATGSAGAITTQPRRGAG